MYSFLILFAFLLIRFRKESDRHICSGSISIVSGICFLEFRDVVYYPNENYVANE